MALTQITEKGIKDGEILNADINASAAIAGTKISPNFGSQDLTTTGSLGGKNLNLTHTIPSISLTDSDGDDDFQIKVDGGLFKLIDATNTADRLVIDSSGNIGLGVSNPSSFNADGRNLIVGTGSGGQGISIYSANNNYGNIYFADGTSDGSYNAGGILYNHSSNFMRFDTAAAERMRIDSSGRVGIGVSSPTRTIDAHVTDSGANYIHLTNATTGAGDSNGTFIGLDAAEGALIWNQESTHVLFATSDSERMRIDSSGRILVNSTSTSIASKLISTIGTGTGVTWGQCGLAITHASGANTKSLIGFGFSGNGGTHPPAAIGSFTNSTSGNENNNLVFFTRSATSDTEPSERMRILSSGKILANRTTEFLMGSDPVDYQFEQITTNAYTLGIHANNTNQRGIGIYYTTGKTADPFFFARIGTSIKTIIRGDGDLENANNSYGSISDVSMKENIVDANSQWNDIKNIKVRNYNFKESTGQQTHTQIGVIAQELETVSPKLVRDSEDGIKTVSYSILYMKAVKALQEAQARIETLETKVAVLEAA